MTGNLVLKFGDKSRALRFARNYFARCRWNVGGGLRSGRQEASFTKSLEEAVRLFQYVRGLPATGEIDAATFGALPHRIRVPMARALRIEGRPAFAQPANHKPAPLPLVGEEDDNLPWDMMPATDLPPPFAQPFFVDGRFDHSEDN